MQPEPNYPGSDRALFALWTLFWLLMMAVAVQDHYSDTGIKWWEPLLWEGSSCLVATVWILLQRRVAHRWDDYLAQPLKWFGKHIAWLPVIAVTFIASIYAIRHGVYALTDETYEHEAWPYTFSLRVHQAGAVLGAVAGDHLRPGELLAVEARTRAAARRCRSRLAESQLAQLKAQLQPHFLFNALNTISSLMQSDVERADRLLTRLADLLRATLANCATSRPRCARNGSCWSCTPPSCRSASRVA